MDGSRSLHPSTIARALRPFATWYKREIGVIVSNEGEIELLYYGGRSKKSDIPEGTLGLFRLVRTDADIGFMRYDIRRALKNNIPYIFLGWRGKVYYFNFRRAPVNIKRAIEQYGREKDIRKKAGMMKKIMHYANTHARLPDVKNRVNLYELRYREQSVYKFLLEERL